MAVTKWNFPGSGNWDLNTNWVPSTVPTGGDVVLDYSQLGGFTGAYGVTIQPQDPIYTIGNLTIDSAANPADSISLMIFGGGLVVDGAFGATGLGNQCQVTNGLFESDTGNFSSDGLSSMTMALSFTATVRFTGLITGSDIGFLFADTTADKLVFGAQGISFAGAIRQFQGNNQIDLTNIAYGNGGFSAVRIGSGLHVLKGGSAVMTFGRFSFSSDTTTATNLIFGNDGTGGTLITLCFAAGTRIATDDGEIAVEHLRAGDRVVTLNEAGRTLQPVRWIGRRRLALRGNPNARAVAPVRVRAGAFADGVPQRDLLLSPDHAVLVETAAGDGTGLIPIRRLINQASIRRESDLASVVYYHVELDRHAILLAEGLRTESYLDAGHRGFFGNATEPLILHPDLTADEPSRAGAAPCAPFLTDEAAVLPVWRRLHDRARDAGLTHAPGATTRDPELLVLAGGREFRPVAMEAGRYVFALQAGLDPARLVSRSAAPADSHPWLDDRRQLGVAIGRIRWHSADGVADIALDHPDLSQGWWDTERSGTNMRRWTNGDAVIPLPGDRGLLELTVAGTGFYAVPGSAPRAPGQSGESKPGQGALPPGPPPKASLWNPSICLGVQGGPTRTLQRHNRPPSHSQTK